MNAIATVGEFLVGTLNYNSAKRKAALIRQQARWKTIEADFAKAEVTEQANTQVIQARGAARGKGFRGGDSIESTISKFAKAEKRKRQIDLSAKAAVTQINLQAAGVLEQAGQQRLLSGIKTGINAGVRHVQASANSPLSTGPKPTNSPTASPLEKDPFKTTGNSPLS